MFFDLKATLPPSLRLPSCLHPRIFLYKTLGDGEPLGLSRSNQAPIYLDHGRVQI